MPFVCSDNRWRTWIRGLLESSRSKMLPGGWRMREVVAEGGCGRLLVVVSPESFSAAGPLWCIYGTSHGLANEMQFF